MLTLHQEDCLAATRMSKKLIDHMSACCAAAHIKVKCTAAGISNCRFVQFEVAFISMIILVRRSFLYEKKNGYSILPSFYFLKKEFIFTHTKACVLIKDS